MPYVSARYAPPDATGLMPEPEDGKRPVIATDDQGVEWHLTEDSQVGDWLRFLETEPTIAEASARNHIVNPSTQISQENAVGKTGRKKT